MYYYTVWNAFILMRLILHQVYHLTSCCFKVLPMSAMIMSACYLMMSIGALHIRIRHWKVLLFIMIRDFGKR